MPVAFKHHRYMAATSNFVKLVQEEQAKIAASLLRCDADTLQLLQGKHSGLELALEFYRKAYRVDDDEL